MMPGCDLSWDEWVAVESVWSPSALCHTQCHDSLNHEDGEFSPPAHHDIHSRPAAMESSKKQTVVQLTGKSWVKGLSNLESM